MFGQKQILLAKKLLPEFEDDLTVQDESEHNDNVDVYTHVRRDNNRFLWHQEVNDKIIPKSTILLLFM